MSVTLSEALAEVIDDNDFALVCFDCGRELTDDEFIRNGDCCDSCAGVTNDESIEEIPSNDFLAKYVPERFRESPDEL
jgi:hypothetical protein